MEKDWKRHCQSSLRKEHVCGATVWVGVDGFVKSGKSTVQLEVLTINHPMMIGIVEESLKIEPLLLN